jgi:precorrin-8X/cobalt-precorrin-8 methylmutase
MSERAFEIERKSFEIIDSEVGVHEYTPEQWAIVRRVVHATADFDFAKGESKIIFHPMAIESAFEAMSRKCTMVTDVDMVLAAVNKKSLSDLGLVGRCYISDPLLAAASRKAGTTRSELAMRHAATDLDGGIAIIGNAPTALYELIRMINEGVCKPSLVVGLPVGFVSAPESKVLLSGLSIPLITNSGRKGGSPAASATMNALMLLYQSRKLPS